MAGSPASVKMEREDKESDAIPEEKADDAPSILSMTPESKQLAPYYPINPHLHDVRVCEDCEYLCLLLDPLPPLPECRKKMNEEII